MSKHNVLLIHPTIQPNGVAYFEENANVFYAPDTDSRSGNRMEHIEFTVWYDDGEQHIPRRLEREKRIGKVEYIDEHTCRFLADVYDASELIPWIRTFICRITDISISNKFLEIQFKKDLQTMYEMYGMEGEK